MMSSPGNPQRVDGDPLDRPAPMQASLPRLGGTAPETYHPKHYRFAPEGDPDGAIPASRGPSTSPLASGSEDPQTGCTGESATAGAPLSDPKPSVPEEAGSLAGRQVEERECPVQKVARSARRWRTPRPWVVDPLEPATRCRRGGSRLGTAPVTGPGPVLVPWERVTHLCGYLLVIAAHVIHEPLGSAELRHTRQFLGRSLPHERIHQSTERCGKRPVPLTVLLGPWVRRLPHPRLVSLDAIADVVIPESHQPAGPDLSCHGVGPLDPRPLTDLAELSAFGCSPPEPCRANHSRGML